MAGAARDIIDPVEAAEDGIGRSRKLIADSLDDLTLHHSWLETYHREERRRAERLRRQETIERLERGRRRVLRSTRHVLLTGAAVAEAVAVYVGSRGLAFLRWAAPRTRLAARRTLKELTVASAWSRQNLPQLTRVGLKATRTGWNWSVQASDEAGVLFRQRFAEKSAAAIDDAMVRSAPARRRAAVGWMRTRLQLRRQRAILEAQIAETMRETPTIIAAQRSARRTAIRGLRAWSRANEGAERIAMNLERQAVNAVIRSGPEIQRRLRMYTPAQVVAPRGSRALIVRPTTALACVTQVRSGLPAPRSV